MELSYDDARELVYGMPYTDWKARYQREATPDQLATFENARPSPETIDIEARAAAIQADVEAGEMTVWRVTPFANETGRMLWLQCGSLISVHATGGVEIQGKNVEPAHALLRQKGWL